MKCNDTFKVSIIGCGNVGATTAYALLLDGAVSEIALVDASKEKANGLLMDLEHSLSFTPFTQLSASDDFDVCSNSDVVIITAGARQKEGETRLDLITKNKAIYADIVPKIAKACPNAILLIVSNPVDVLTYEAIKLSGLPAGRVFGSGTLLDTARLQFHISQKLGVHPSSINAFILGEHGDTSFPVFSSADIAGKPLLAIEAFTKEIAQECFTQAKNSAYRIIHDQGYTCYSIATATLQIIKAIVEDNNRVFPLSTLVEDFNGVSEVCLSVPCVLGRNGIQSVIHVPLNEDEKAMLLKSAETIKKYIN